VKVRVVLNIEVDPADWDLVYGTGTRARDVAEDIRRYAHNQVQQSAGAEESHATVQLAR
jgi:hypothetical protein